ncbi:hypothetical protein AAXB25_29260 [Paenibacillus lautus]|uniref:hypothetical protein n=1 Tax=Paenibacillus lautus TaxID=1401 RepID=UPI003D2A011A
MKERKTIKLTGYFYGIILFLIVFGVAAFSVYLVYLLVVKASTNQFADTTVLQAMLTLIISVLIGTILTKSLESRNAKRLEVFKIRKDVSININLSGVLLSSDESEKQRAFEILHNENMKVKLFFDDETVRAVKKFLEEKSLSSYEEMTDMLKKHLN